MCFSFFFNDTATPEIYTLSLHDALPICPCRHHVPNRTLCELPITRSSHPPRRARALSPRPTAPSILDISLWFDLCTPRSEEHTSELQSRQYLVCRLLLEKKQIKQYSDRD